MAIVFRCSCGRSLKAPDTAAGRKARCSACAAILTVPSAQAAVLEGGLEPAQIGGKAPIPGPTLEYGDGSSVGVEPPRRAAVARGSGLTTGDQPGAERALQDHAGAWGAATGPGLSFQQYLYLLLFLTLIPLALSIGRETESFKDRLRHTIKAHPELLEPGGALAEALGHDEVTRDDVIMALPGHRLDGALLARNTYAHWLMALLSGAAFLALLLFMFPRGAAPAQSLLLALIFTASIGVFLLMAFQWFADLSLPGVTLPGKVWLIVMVVKFIGFSYACADDPSNGFLLSFMGFTCGVGFCEELTKAIPVLFRIRSVPGQSDLSWRGACLWGMASGVGFGVAEGIRYASRYYNGSSTGSIYLVRFASCVALHAAWAGTAGIMIYKWQGRLHGAESRWGYMGNVALILSIPMILHGLYDTLLKRGNEGAACMVAVGSLVLMAGMIEWLKRTDPDDSADVVGAA